MWLSSVWLQHAIRPSIGYVVPHGYTNSYILQEITDLVEVIFQLALGVFCFWNPFVEGNIDITALFAHVIGCLLKDSVNQGAEFHRALALSLRLQNVSIWEILPIFWAYRAINKSTILSDIEFNLIYILYIFPFIAITSLGYLLGFNFGGAIFEFKSMGIVS